MGRDFIPNLNSACSCFELEKLVQPVLVLDEVVESRSRAVGVGGNASAP
jgi:hypothetical protein